MSDMYMRVVDEEDYTLFQSKKELFDDIRSFGKEGAKFYKLQPIEIALEPVIVEYAEENKNE